MVPHSQGSFLSPAGSFDSHLKKEANQWRKTKFRHYSFLLFISFFLKLIGTAKVAKHTLDPLLVLWLVKLQPLQDLEENDSQRKIWDSSSPFLARLKWACICMHISWSLSQLWLWHCFHPEPPLHLPVPSSQYWEWGLSSDLGCHGNVHIYVVVTSKQLMLTKIVCMCMLAAFFLMALCLLCSLLCCGNCCIQCLYMYP